MVDRHDVGPVELAALPHIEACLDAAHGCRSERFGAVPDAGAGIGPVDRGGGRRHVGFDLAVVTDRAHVDVLAAVLPDSAAVAFPPLPGVHVRAAFRAPGERPGFHIGARHSFAVEHNVEPVTPLGCARIVVSTNVGGGHADELMLVAEGRHPGQPHVEQLPPGGLDHVLDQDDLVAVDFSGADDLPERDAGPGEPFLRDMPPLFEQVGLGVFLPATAGRRQFGADRGRPQDRGSRQVAQIHRLDVRAQVFGARVVR